MQLQQNWKLVQQRIIDSCHRVDRNPNDVQVVAVTKYVDVDTTQAVLDSGLNQIGESKVQDAVPKWKQIGDRGVWHFIGHLQRNKVKEIIGRFQYLHSLDRWSLAQELDKRLKQRGESMKCFLQVNVAQEKQKNGIYSHELKDFALDVANLSSIEIVGLMTMAPLTPNSEEVRPVFRELKRLQHELQQLQHPQIKVPHLSMGMSQDFEVAIEEGATWVRLGSVLVGKRS
ncbi:hypothetical protein SAMN05444392_10287 [Seinonella peptonophila]|uniref:Pyridoxal phosphate homeostasis protein n=1 Tax=Seinonella peptonophila TaxID=112248 RepID=A0A1M4UYN3_9BACL|nr:YggS family pyridoxal phosphate-dependent enzyme [Seinonella peptonophila]SHE61836.1 hypothetical protein SAMN05444392_10287 [Seinonella peptonophila]